MVGGSWERAVYICTSVRPLKRSLAIIAGIKSTSSLVSGVVQAAVYLTPHYQVLLLL